uniref:Uncharacterized protein n=1 Tax=Fusarium oxysporum (strain Fo5176) TaxID=660025 RepID=A0A0D2YH79_FUSOF
MFRLLLRLTKANPLATTLTRLSRTPRLPLFHPRSRGTPSPSSSSRLSLLQYPLGLPSDGLEPLVVQAAEGCFDKRVAVVERVYEQEYLATKGCQPSGSAVDDSSVPLKWVAGRRLGPAEEQLGYVQLGSGCN